MQARTPVAPVLPEASLSYSQPTVLTRKASAPSSGQLRSVRPGGSRSRGHHSASRHKLILRRRSRYTVFAPAGRARLVLICGDG